MNPFYKNLSLWIVITLMFVMLYQIFSEQRLAETPVSYSEFLAMVADERVGEGEAGHNLWLSFVSFSTMVRISRPKNHTFSYFISVYFI